MKVVWFFIFTFLGLCYVYIAIDSYCKSGKALRRTKVKVAVEAKKIEEKESKKDLKETQDTLKEQESSTKSE